MKLPVAYHHTPKSFCPPGLCCDARQGKAKKSVCDHVRWKQTGKLSLVNLSARLEPVLREIAAARTILTRCRPVRLSADD